jgi:hypothetical protein
MTVGALSSKIDYLENGVTLAYAAPFRFLSGALQATRVLADGTVVPLVEGVDFTVSGGETDAGGTLTLLSTIAGSRLRIRRKTARAQSTAYSVSDRFPAESHENALDRSMMVDQEQDDKIGDLNERSLVVPDGEIAQPLPAKADRALKYLFFDADGNPLATAAVVDLVLNEVIGRPVGSTDMGASPGSILSNNGSALQWFLELEAALSAILAGGVSFDLPDEADGDPIPPPGSRLPYLSAGVLKIA